MAPVENHASAVRSTSKVRLCGALGTNDMLVAHCFLAWTVADFFRVDRSVNLDSFVHIGTCKRCMAGILDSVVHTRSKWGDTTPAAVADLTAAPVPERIVTSPTVSISYKGPNTVR